MNQGFRIRNQKISSVGIIGYGHYGQALGKILEKNKVKTLYWFHHKKKDKNQDEIKSFDSSFKDFLKRSEYLLITVPMEALKDILKKVQNELKNPRMMIGTKGIEEKSGKTISDLVGEIFGERIQNELIYLSGPSFARELWEGKKTGLVVASKREKNRKLIKELFENEQLSMIETEDVTGTELGGAIKNVIAIAAGIVDGQNWGMNAKAYIMTQGFKEMAELGVQKGGKVETFLGLSGFGDLVLTSTGRLSRNYRLGEKLGSGKEIKELMANQVIEGVKTASGAYHLAKRLEVKVPLIEGMYQILYQNQDISKTMESLMLVNLDESFGSF